MGSKTGYCGDFSRFLLVILNIMFFNLGLIIIGISFIMKFGVNVMLGIDKDLSKIINQLLGEFESYLIVFIVIGLFLLVASAFGLFGACYANDNLLVVYSILKALLFLVHIIMFIIIVSKFHSIVESVLDDIIDGIKDTSSKDLQIASCLTMSFISNNLECCGKISKLDLSGDPNWLDCCPVLTGNKTNNGCLDMFFNESKGFKIYALIAPNLIIMSLEAAYLVLAGIIFCSIRIRNKENFKNYHKMDKNDIELQRSHSYEYSKAVQSIADNSIDESIKSQ